MKKLIAFVCAMAFVLSLVGCGNTERMVWDWTQGLSQEDIACVTPWNDDPWLEDNAFEALNHAEILTLVVLLNKLTKDSFTENKNLAGITPTFGIGIMIASETYYINEADSPWGSLEIKYNEKMWWIDNAELLDFVQSVTNKKPTE